MTHTKVDWNNTQTLHIISHPFSTVKFNIPQTDTAIARKQNGLPVKVQRVWGETNSPSAILLDSANHLSKECSRPFNTAETPPCNLNGRLRTIFQITKTCFTFWLQERSRRQNIWRLLEDIKSIFKLELQRFRKNILPHTRFLLSLVFFQMI